MKSSTKELFSLSPLFYYYEAALFIFFYGPLETQNKKYAEE